MISENPPYFCLEGIEKKFPGVHALKNIDFDLNKGECVALLGENGAGKSTLIKIMGGAQRADSGILKVDEEVQFWMNPIDSINAGVAVIYQEFNLVPGLTVAENILLGIEPQNFGIVRKKDERKQGFGNS